MQKQGLNGSHQTTFCEYSNEKSLDSGTSALAAMLQKSGQRTPLTDQEIGASSGNEPARNDSSSLVIKQQLDLINGQINQLIFEKISMQKTSQCDDELLNQLLIRKS